MYTELHLWKESLSQHSKRRQGKRCKTVEALFIIFVFPQAILDSALLRVLLLLLLLFLTFDLALRATVNFTNHITSYLSPASNWVLTNKNITNASNVLFFSPSTNNAQSFSASKFNCIRHVQDWTGGLTITQNNISLFFLIKIN